MNTRADRSRTTQPRRRHWARRTHRILGIASLAFIILISLSGLILNHADGLGLSRQAAGPLLLRIYGIEIPPVDAAYSAGDTLFASSSGTVFADSRAVVADTANIVGAVGFTDGLVVATRNELLLFSHEGQLVERQQADQMQALTRVGSDGNE